MKKYANWVVRIVVLIFAVFVFMLIYHINSSPKDEILRLPDNQISLGSTKGLLYLSESLRVDYDKISSFFEAQEHMAYCGVASSVAIINGLHGKKILSQQSYFKPEIKPSLLVKFSGLTLNQLNDHFMIHGMETRIIRGNAISLELFRELAIKNIQDPSNFIVLNYHRKSLNQVGGGHISPIVAYHEKSDSMLVMDTAAHKYPMTWINTQSLWKAIDTEDAEGIYRGLLEVSR